MHRDVMEQSFIREVEAAVNRDMVAQCRAVMNKMQHVFGVDIWDIGDYMEISPGYMG